jgi:hypothetical protein
VNWFRFYDEVVEDPKVQQLPPEVFKAWVNLMCLAAKNSLKRGDLPDLASISYQIHMRRDKTQTTINILLKAGLLERVDGVLRIHNWNKRQYQSDSSTPRVKRFRNSPLPVSETAAETFQKRPQNTDTETEGSPQGSLILDSPHGRDSPNSPPRASLTRALGDETFQKPEKSGTENPGNGTKPSPPKDAAYAVFVEAHRLSLDAVYQPQRSDFVQLAALRKANGVDARASPPHWDEAVSNYFHSALALYTVRDLCARYAMFRNGAVDRYGRLGGNADEQRRQANRDAVREFLGEGAHGVR